MTLRVSDGHGLSVTETAQTSVTELESVVWTHVVGAVAIGNSLEKTAGPGSNAGAVSVVKIGAGDGYMEFSAGNAAQVGYVGLGNGDTGQDGADIEYAFRLGASQSLSVYESGVLLAQATTARMRRPTVSASPSNRGKVNFANGSVVYTSAAQPNYALTVDTALQDTGAMVSNVQIAGQLHDLGPAVGNEHEYADGLDDARGDGAGLAGGIVRVERIRHGRPLFSGNRTILALPLRAIKGRGDAGYDMTLRLERNWAIQKFEVPVQGGVFEHV